MTDHPKKPLEGRCVAVLATDGVEQVELTEPVDALRAAGATVSVVAPKSGSIQAFQHLDKGKEIPVDRELASASPLDFDALVLPGGVANPDQLRMNEKAVQFVREFVEADKPVGAICHAPWMLIEAGLVKGRTLTSWPSLRTDVENAGGEWVDKAVVVDQKLVTSRKPDDLPQFCERLVEAFASAADESSLDAMVEQSFPASDPLPSPTTATGEGSSASSGAARA
ncbi:MAG TPA: type 1 glutamine amidotransferase domain-containing protein [Gemmatimonadaceae bacterium]|jgi:protease I